MKEILACILLSFVFKVESGVTYTDVWPLGESTCGFDVITGIDAKWPKLDDCCIASGSRHPNLSYNSLSFSGASHLDLSVTGNDIDNIAFMVNFKPAVLSGTIFHFIETEAGCDCLYDLRVDIMTNGTLSVSVHARTMSQLATKLIPSIVITTTEWHYLSVALHNHDGEMYIVYQKYGSPAQQQTIYFVDWHAHLRGNQRRLRVGANKDGENYFSGDITCVSLAKDTQTPPYVESIGYCQQAFSGPPATPKCNMNASWVIPTYKTNAGYDVKQRMPRRHQDSGRDLRVNPIPTPLNYGSLLMDGSPFSTLDLNFNPSSLQNDFTLTFYVKANQSVMGTLAHARMSAAAGQVLKEVVVSVNVIQATVTFLDGEGSVCSEVTASRSTQSSWDVVGVGRKGDRLFLMYGSDEAKGTSSCSVNPSLSGTGLLRLGGSLNEGEGFHGNLACFVLFEKYAYSAKFTIDACQGPHSIPPESPRASATEENYRMSLMRSDAEPLATLLNESTLGSEFMTRSVAECAKECRLHHHCRSFTVSKVKDSSRERRCRLLDFLTREGLQARTGTNYYAMVEIKHKP